MARTTLAAVNKIIQYDSTNIPDPQLMLDSASLMVTNVIGTALDASTAELVERYLAAHLIAISDPRIQSEQVKTIQASYQVRLSDGLGITHFGSTAMMLDSSGKLAVWNNKVVKGMVKFDLFWAGKAGDTDVTY
ncbi:MAG: hypothetical protein EBR82_55850 [Caulobacteraceae bacterium]|nr:hypothetical protein [Caulobacteraceae bacterium]